jgi:excisionase family DNA binding protein
MPSTNIRPLEPIVVPVNEACRLLNLGRVKLYQLINSKQIARVKVGKRTLIPIASLHAFIEGQVKEAA